MEGNSEEKGSKRIKIVGDLWDLWVIIQYDDEESRDTKIFKNTYFTTLEEAKSNLESYYKTKATGRLKELFTPEKVYTMIVSSESRGGKVDRLTKKIAKTRSEDYKKFSDKTLEESEYPWTEICQYYANEFAEFTDQIYPDSVHYMKIIKISR